MKYAVIIPVFNERALLPVMLERLMGTPPVVGPDGSPLERLLVVVDDCSTDGTRGLVEQLSGRDGVTTAMHPVNRGKGAAVRTGFAAALGAGADILVIHDADLEYDARDHQCLLEPILDGRADAVFGSRFLGRTHRVLYFWHYAANRFITLCSNLLTNLNLTDIECCLKAFSRDAAASLGIEEDRFGIEPEIIAKVSRLRSRTDRAWRPRIYEVAVSYAGRTYAEGKKIGWRDGFAALWCIAKYNLRG